MSVAKQRSIYHITYRRNGATEVHRLPASSRSEAIRSAAWALNVPRGAIVSAVAGRRVG